MNITAEPMVPNRKATSALLLENNFTDKIPSSEQISPVDARASGMNCNTDLLPPRTSKDAIDIDAASAIDAIIAPQ